MNGGTSAQLLAAIVSSSDDAIISKNLDGYVTSWNAGAVRLFGYAPEEMIGEHITRIIPPERISEEEYVLSRIRGGDAVDHFETVRRRKDGTLVDVSLTISPVRSAAGGIVGASKIARDITDRKRMEADLRRLAAIVESSEDAIISKNLGGVVLTWNSSAERIFGYTAAEAIGREITLIVPADRASEEDEAIARIRTGERVPAFETIRRRKDGRLIDVSVSISPIRSGDAQVVGASTVARDITQQKRLQFMAEEASRAKDEFLATLSHELRTPLNTVAGYTQMLQSGVLSGSDMPKALAAIARNADVLTRLVNDVLDASRIVTGKIFLNLGEHDISALAEESLAALAPAFGGKSLRVITNIEPALAAVCDADRLRQVLWNLLSNAVKFSHEGGTLKFSAVSEARSVRITVEDSGVGIAAESLPYVFQRFWQADPTNTRAHGGLGLGLALVRTFVELHGGHVEAHSGGLGRGARFDVVLPTTPVIVQADA